MATKGEQTRENILATAERLILQRGYVGTSIEDILTETGITKGGFFYHFDGKRALAKALVERYLAQDAAFFGGLIERAAALTEDPLQRYLIFLKLLAEAMADLPGSHPGCLVASFTYESQQFDDELTALNAEGILAWRRLFVELLESAAAKHAPRVDVSLLELADMLTAVIEGGIILSKALDARDLLPQQLLQYRSYVRLVFGDT